MKEERKEKHILQTESKDLVGLGACGTSAELWFHSFIWIWLFWSIPDHHLPSLQKGGGGGWGK